METEKTSHDIKRPWYLCVAGIILAAVIFALAPSVIALVDSLLETFTPNFFRKSEYEIWAFGFVVSAVLASVVFINLSGERKIFHTIVFAIFGIFVTITGVLAYTWGLSYEDVEIGRICGGITFIVFAVYPWVAPIWKGRKKNGHNT